MNHIVGGTTHFKYYLCAQIDWMYRQYNWNSCIAQHRVHTVYQTKKRFHHCRTGSMSELHLKYATHCTDSAGGINVHDILCLLFRHRHCNERKGR